MKLTHAPLIAQFADLYWQARNEKVTGREKNGVLIYKKI